MSCGGRVGGKSAVVANGRGSWIVGRRNELHFLIFETKIVEGLLDQIGVLVAHLTKLSLRHPHKKRTSAGVTVASGLQPGVVRMPIDLFFQRVKDAQPRI